MRTISGGRVLQRHDLDVLVAGLVDAPDDAEHAIHVGGAIRDDQHVAAGVRDEVPVLRDQRPQDRHELRGADVVQLHDLGGEVIGTRRTRGADLARELPRRGVRDNLDQVAAVDGDVAVHLQDRQECLVQCVRAERRRRQQRHAARDTRVEDEILAGDG